MACGGLDEPDAACAELDASAPVCIDDACVQCSEDDTSACTGATPVCDVESSTCVPCRFHFECREIGLPACHIAEGSCFGADTLASVATGTPNALSTALGAGAEPIVVELSGNGEVAEDNTVSIAEGRVVAIIAAQGASPSIEGNGGPTFDIQGDGTTVYFERVNISGNLNNAGIVASDQAAVFLDETRVVQNDGGGLQVTSGAQANLRNCFVTGPNDGTALDVSGSTAEVLYSTLGANFGDAAALRCGVSDNVSVRNSILVSRGDTALACPITPTASSIVTSASDPATDVAWFVDFNGGNFALVAGHPFDGVAQWEDGDPPFDIDVVDLRPTVDGTADVAGADLP